MVRLITGSYSQIGTLTAPGHCATSTGKSMTGLAWFWNSTRGIALPFWDHGQLTVMHEQLDVTSISWFLPRLLFSNNEKTHLKNGYWRKLVVYLYTFWKTKKTILRNIPSEKQLKTPLMTAYLKKKLQLLLTTPGQPLNPQIIEPL